MEEEALMPDLGRLFSEMREEDARLASQRDAVHLAKIKGLLLGASLFLCLVAGCLAIAR
ncbi:hypothetical protein NKJ59_13060 [Mesorhizobium australicum]|uniref:hypothetical protein n=1 Tax=Mesorhizobium australicum TaxID=536018 RepID=UPI00333CF1DA